MASTDLPAGRPVGSLPPEISGRQVHLTAAGHEWTIDIGRMIFTKLGRNVGAPSCRTRYPLLALQSGAHTADSILTGNVRTELDAALDELDACHRLLEFVLEER